MENEVGEIPKNFSTIGNDHPQTMISFTLKIYPGQTSLINPYRAPLMPVFVSQPIRRNRKRRKQ